MRCPKCGYISFDHNEACPKCNRNLSTERSKLNLLSFPPEPPSLLGSLIGEMNDSGMHFHSADTGAFNVLEEEIEFEAKTEEIPTPSLETEKEVQEIQIELESLVEEEGPSAGESLEETELETVATEPDEELLDLELEAIEEETKEKEEEPVVLEMDELILEKESAPQENIETNLHEAELFEIDTGRAEPEELAEQALGDQEQTQLLQDEALMEEDTPLTSELIEKEEGLAPIEGETEPSLSLEDLKDDELGEVDVTIDDLPTEVKNLAEGQGG